MRYTRSGSPTVVITDGWEGRQAFRVTDADYASRVEWSDRDFFIPVASLLIDDVLTEPQRGDRIEVTYPEPYGTKTFEIAAPVGERPWRFSDHTGQIYRIHTKQKAVS